MNLKTLAAALLFAGTIPAFAQTTTPTPPPTAQQRIDQRQANQQKRIDEGVKSGSLTTREAERLQKGQARVGKMEHKAAADGAIDKKEARRIERAQDKQSRKISREKHDRQHDVNHDGKDDQNKYAGTFKHRQTPSGSHTRR